MQEFGYAMLSNDGIISIEEYRRLMGDHDSTDEQIVQRVRYMEGLCRAVIQAELQNHGKNH